MFKALLAWAEAVEHVHQLQVAVTRMVQSTKLRAFLSWAEIGGAEAVAAQRIRKALVALGASDRGGKLRRGYNSWAELMYERNEEKARLREAVMLGRVKRGVRRLRQWLRSRRALQQWHFAVAPSVQRRTAGYFHEWWRWAVHHKQEVSSRERPSEK